MAVVTPAQTQAVSRRSRLSPYAPATGYLALSVAVGGLAGATALAAQLHLLPAGFEARMAGFHPSAMLLFVGIPAFLGAFGRLFLTHDLMRGGVKALPWLDGAALAAMLMALLMFLSGAAHAELSGMCLWSLGAVLMSASTVAIICDSRAGAGLIAPRGQERVSGLVPFSLFVWTQLCAALGLLLTAPVLAAGATRELLGASGVMPRFEMPATLIVLVAAFGLAARVFDTIAPVGQKLKAMAVAIIATVAIGGPVLWGRMAFVCEPGFRAAGGNHLGCCRGDHFHRDLDSRPVAADRDAASGSGCASVVGIRFFRAACCWLDGFGGAYGGSEWRCVRPVRRFLRMAERRDEGALLPDFCQSAVWPHVFWCSGL